MRSRSRTTVRSAAPRSAASPRRTSPYFLNDRRKRPLGIADLEDIAFYYNLTVGELFAPHGRKSELSGPEQRLLLAYAAAPPTIQAAVMAILEDTPKAPRRRFSGGHALALTAPTLLDAV